MTQLQDGDTYPLAVACWELSDEGFKDPLYLKNYIQNLANQLSAKVEISIK